MTITTKELASAIKNMPTNTDVEADAVVRAFIGAIRDGVVSGERVELRGFCSVMTHDKPARMGRNPRTGQSAPIAARRAAVFKAGKALRDALNA